MSTMGGESHKRIGVMTPVLKALFRVRAVARRQLVVQRSLWIVAAGLVAVLVLGLIDYLLRLPMPIRLFHLLVGLFVAGYWIRRSVLPALRFRPSLTDVALRLENSSTGQSAGLPGLLASGLELAERGGGDPLTDELADSVAAKAASRYAAFARSARLFDRRPLLRGFLATACTVAPLILLALLAPLYFRIGAERTLTPWREAAWPKRTGIVDAGAPPAHAAGTALPLRAILVKTDRAAGKTDVTLAYRLVVDGKGQEERRVLMTPQNRQATAPGGDGSMGEVFERLLDADAITPAGPVGPESVVAVEYWFRTSDDETNPARVLVVQPPAIIAARAKVTPPAYAAAALSASQAESVGEQWLVGDRDVGPGSSARGVVGPVLSGSSVEFALRFNKALPVLSAGPGEAIPGVWAEQFFPGIGSMPDLVVGSLADGTFVLGFTADRAMRVPVSLRDEHGIASGEDYVLRLEVIEDRAPTVSIVEPSQDESVLPTARVTVAGEGRDDVSLKSVSLHRQAARPAEGSVGAAPEPIGENQVLGEQVVAPGSVSVRQEVMMDLTPLSLKPGDEIWLTAAATDVFEVAGAPRAPVISSKRRLRIIAEAELIEQVRAELAALREAAKRAEQDQSALSARSGDAVASEQAAGEQATRQEAVTQRLKPMKDSVRRLSDRVERNQLADAALDGVLKDAAELTDSASRASERASDALERLATPTRQREADQTIREAAQELEKAREQVEDDLTQLSNMLDRGQDDWAVRRAIEKALTEQKQLRAQTAAAGRANQGKQSKDLTEKEREELSRLARQQAELGQRSQAMVDSVRQRSEQMAQADPAQSQAMQNAAQKGQRQELAKQQQRASEQIAQNNTGEAEQTQQEAQDTLEAMLEELDKSRQHRDEALRRVLADVMQSIRQLIDRQQAELKRLAEADAGTISSAGLDESMIALQKNTLAVAATVKSQVRGAEVLAGLLGAAGQAQSAAVVTLRSQPPDFPEADANERVSLKRLQEALEEASRMDDEAQEREEDRKRAELKKAYKELLELQVAIVGDVSPMIGRELDRRQRSLARALGERQEVVRGRMADLREKTSEFEEVRLFDYAHSRFETVASRAARTLEEGRAPAGTGRDLATAVRILQGLVQALDEAQSKKDEFKDDEPQEGDGGGGQSGKPPLIPPMAELKLLRAMQAEAFDRTRDIEGDADPGELEAIGRLQRDLAEHGAQLLDKLMQNEAPPQPGSERN